jgi:N-dimethylarginine dimethylaminohydrolase
MYGAQSEYEPLQKVVMHRPSREVDLVTEKNKSEFLFADTVSKEKMQKEHDAFVTFLQGEHVEVIDPGNTLCPNLVFTRDVASVTKKGAVLMRPKYAARIFEPYYMEKCFNTMNIPVIKTTTGCCEGGDLVYLTEDSLMVGVGPRTDVGGLSELANLFLGTTIKTVISIPLPSWRVHLDGTLMILGKDIAVIHPDSLMFPARILPDNELVDITQYLKDDGFDLIEVTFKEMKQFGPNIFVVRPELAVSYSWNTRIINELKERSFEIFELDGHELVKAGGGPHCMTCPVLRK